MAGQVKDSYLNSKLRLRSWRDVDHYAGEMSKYWVYWKNECWLADADRYDLGGVSQTSWSSPSPYREYGEGYEKQKQLVGVKRRGRKHHPTLPLHPVAHLPYHPTLPLHPTTHLPYHPTLPHTYHTPTTHLPHTYPKPTLPCTYHTPTLPVYTSTSTTTRILNTKQ